MNTIHQLAQDLCDTLAPGCERIEIAGSIRRGKPDPKDIELVAIPRVSDEMQELDLFGNVTATIECNHLHNALQQLYANGTGAWTLDPDLPRNGPKYKRLKYWGQPPVCCDLFITTPESWGVIFTIRTGPGDFSKELVTRARRLSMQVDGGQLWRTHRDGKRDVVPTPTEAAFFEALGLPYLVPAERTTQALKALSMKARP